MEFEVQLLPNVVDFILSLSDKMQAKIQRSIELLKTFGYKLPEPHSKKIVNFANLNELRVKLGTDIGRLFYFYYKNQIYVITSGYIKKDNKLKKSEIDKAIKLMKYFKETTNE